MAEKAFQQAVEDILNDCEIQGKCFMAFRSKLNPIMDQLVDEHIKLQEQVKH